MRYKINKDIKSRIIFTIEGFKLKILAESDIIVLLKAKRNIDKFRVEVLPNKRNIRKNKLK